MISAKHIFLSDRALADWLLEVVHDARFEKALIFADGEFINYPSLNDDMIKGMKLYKMILTNLPENLPSSVKVHPPVLNQNFDQPPAKRRPQPRQQTATTKPNENSKPSP